MGPRAGGLTSKPVTYCQHPRRGTCPTGLAPRKASQVGFGQLAGSGPILSPPALLSAYVPGLRLTVTRTRATKDADSDVGLATAPLQSWDDSDDGPTTGPLQSPGGSWWDLSAARTRWLHLRPRLDPATPPSSVSPTAAGPRARAPAPGRAKHVNEPHSVL